MKKNVKLLLWSFVVVPFVVAAVMVFCLNGQNSTVKPELGPVGWDKMMKITGGAVESTDRCGEEEVNCGTGGVQVNSCDKCDEWNLTTGWFYPDGVSYTEYANTGVFYSVGDGDSNQIAHVNNFNVPCKRTVWCVHGPVVEPGHCAGSDCSGNGPFGKCIQYSAPAELPEFEKHNKGRCADP
jgi:hypothetical protein